MLATSILTVSLLSSSKTPKRRIWRCAICLVDAKIWGSDVYTIWVNDGNRPNRLVALFWSLEWFERRFVMNLVGAFKHFVYCSMVQSQHLGKSLLHTFRVSWRCFTTWAVLIVIAWMAIFPTKWRNKWANEQLLGGWWTTKQLKPLVSRRSKRFPGHSMFFWMVFIPNTSPPKGTFWRCCSLFPSWDLFGSAEGNWKDPPCCLLRAWLKSTSPEDGTLRQKWATWLPLDGKSVAKIFPLMMNSMVGL